MRPVFIIEDDESIRTLLAEILREDGYAVETDPDGTAALARLRAGFRPGLVVVDLHLGAMDGRTFRTMVKSEPALGVCPFALMSASPPTDEDRLAFDVILPKPLDLDEMLRVVAKYCGQHAGS